MQLVNQRFGLENLLRDPKFQQRIRGSETMSHLQTGQIRAAVVAVRRKQDLLSDFLKKSDDNLYLNHRHQILARRQDQRLTKTETLLTLWKRLCDTIQIIHRRLASQ